MDYKLQLCVVDIKQIYWFPNLIDILVKISRLAHSDTQGCYFPLQTPPFKKPLLTFHIHQTHLRNHSFLHF